MANTLNRATTLGSAELSLSTGLRLEGSSDSLFGVQPALKSQLHSRDRAGVFTVERTGQVSVEYLFDGGSYQGQIAIFSLDGLEKFGLGSVDWIKEAARRALSQSTLGHVVLSDATESARFQGRLPWEKDFNSGKYAGSRSFTMRPDDQFGILFVPNGTVQDVFAGRTKGARQPLFSLDLTGGATGLSSQQMVDVTGYGSTFAFEDLPLTGKTDRDYNDVIFQVRGAVGTAARIEDLINSNRDWQKTTIGQQILDYAVNDDQARLWNLAKQFPTIEAPKSAHPLIGIVDTGFHALNPDIDYSRLLLGRDRIDNDNDPLLYGNGNEHGTHLLGLIGAIQGNNIGIDGINKTAPIWLGRAIESGQWADSLAEFVTAHIASNQPNAVINLSLDLTQLNPDGSISTRYELTPAERAAIEFARQHQVLLVVAAGNGGGTMSALGQASQEFDNIITVGSASRFNRADYSSYGFGLDLLAIGGTDADPILSTIGTGFGMMAGTSVAAAKVTGVISQVWAVNPKLNYRQVIDLIKASAIDLGQPNWDAETGFGLLNPTAALEIAQVTTAKDHEAPASIIPETWAGEGRLIALERAAFTGASWSGKVTATIGANLRSGPGTNFQIVGSRAYNSSLSFDGWTTGQFISYPGLGSSDRWYRIAGTNQWISGAIVNNAPPNNPPFQPPQPPQPTFVPINSNSSNYRNGQRNPFAYNPALIGQCTWYAYGRMQEMVYCLKTLVRIACFWGMQQIGSGMHDV